MRYDLRPRSAVEILHQALRLLRGHLLGLTAASIAFSIPWAFLGFWSQQVSMTSTALRTLVFLGQLAFFLAYPLVQLLVTRAAANAYTLGSPCLAASLRDARKMYLSYLTTFVFMMLTLGAAFCLLLIPGIFLAVGWAAVTPVVVLEQLTGSRARKRSRELVQGSWWRSAAVLAFGGVAYAAVVVSHLILDGGSWRAVVLEGIVSGMSQAFTHVLMTVLYFDLRHRTEAVGRMALARSSEADVERGLPTAASTAASEL